MCAQLLSYRARTAVEPSGGRTEMVAGEAGSLADVRQGKLNLFFSNIVLPALAVQVKVLKVS